MLRAGQHKFGGSSPALSVNERSIAQYQSRTDSKSWGVPHTPISWLVLCFMTNSPHYSHCIETLCPISVLEYLLPPPLPTRSLSLSPCFPFLHFSPSLSKLPDESIATSGRRINVHSNFNGMQLSKTRLSLFSYYTSIWLFVCHQLNIIWFSWGVSSETI